MTENSLKQLEKLGQSIWLDYIQRDLIRSGELKRMIEEDGLRGMTSNPTLFEQAIAQTDFYTNDIKNMVQDGKKVQEIYDVLTWQDVQEAADVFHGTFLKTKGKDGYVSLEVNPHLAHETEQTINEARRLWQAVGRPNIFIKVPGTREGLPAITQLISEGINVNVTLLFGIPRYHEVADAYLKGLEIRHKNGEPLHQVRSVASFFLSRIDVLADGILEKMLAENSAQNKTLAKLHGQIAIASAKKAYNDYQAIFADDRFKKLTSSGANTQRLLWASTSTKNKSYSDIKYVEPLIGPDTVNTMPLETLEHYLDHGKPEARLEKNLDETEWVLNTLPEVGIDLEKITQQLEDEGVVKFNKGFDELIAALEKHCANHKNR